MLKRVFMKKNVLGFEGILDFLTQFFDFERAPKAAAKNPKKSGWLNSWPICPKAAGSHPAGVFPCAQPLQY